MNVVRGSVYFILLCILMALTWYVFSSLADIATPADLNHAKDEIEQKIIRLKSDLELD